MAFVEKHCGWMDSVKHDRDTPCKNKPLLTFKVDGMERRICKKHMLRLIKGHIKTMEEMQRVIREEMQYGDHAAIRWGPD